MLMTIVATLICEIISYAIQIIAFKLNIELFPFIKIIFMEILYNTMIIIIIYPIIEKLGELLEKVFLRKNILTKYF